MRHGITESDLLINSNYKPAALRALCAACALNPALALAQDSGVVGVDVQKLANAVLAVMGFTDSGT